MTLLRKLRHTLQWVEDLRSGEMIEQRFSGSAYTRDYMSFSSISQKDLDWLCDVVNYILTEEGNGELRIRNHMGEIIPAKSSPKTVFDLRRAILKD